MTTNKMNVLIIEDEKPAADKLELLLKRSLSFMLMDELDEVLDPELFFRINRTFIIHINGIKDVIIYSNSRLKILLHQAFDKELIVSREKVNPFKIWFGMR